MMSERKLFTAELQRLKQQAARVDAGYHRSEADNSEVMDVLRDINGSLKNLECLIRGQDPTEFISTTIRSSDLDEAIAQKQAEVSMLKTELRALAVCIEHTKHEIAALRPQDSQEDRLMAVTFELDAIVSATESATETILESAEKIEGLVREIQAHGGDAYVKRLTEDINETVVSMFEACNFQDITGQRITKVVKTLQYIEARVSAMIQIWGPENIAEIVPKVSEEHKDEEAKLLNGPALENQGISQDDIDKLFG